MSTVQEKVAEVAAAVPADSQAPSATATVKSNSDHDIEKHAEDGSAPASLKDGASEDPSQYPTGLKFILINLAVCLVVFLCALDQTIVATAVPIITNDFNSFSDVGWYASAYLLTSTAFQPLFGRLYASYSVKWTFFAAVFIFELGSLICALAQDSTTLIGGRAVAGVGLAGGYSGALIIITLIAPMQTRPLLLSLVGATYGIGATVGPIIGGALTSQVTWRWCFWLNLCLYPPVLIAVVLFLSVPERKHEDTWWQRALKIDWQGTALVICSIVCILLVCQWGGVKYAWSDSKIIGLIVGFFVIALAFAADQVWMGERATIPLRIYRNRTVFFGSIVNFMVAAAYFSLLYFLPIYFQSVRGSSAIRSGVQTLPFIIAVIFTVTLTGGLVNKFGHYIPFLFIGMGLLALGSGMLVFMGPYGAQPRWVGLQFFAGLGAGMAWMLPFTASSNALEPKDIELGSAVVIFFQTLGGTIFVSVAQSIFQNKFAIYLRHIDGVDVNEIIAHGVTAFRAFTPPASLPAVIEACSLAVNKTYIMSAVLAGVGFFAVFGMELNRKIGVQGAPAMAG